MKLKIISDGTGFGTRVVNAETGEAVRGVTSVTWSIDEPRGLASAIITIRGVAADVGATAPQQDVSS